MAIVAKRTIMSLYSDNDDLYSHQVRIVLAEKGVNFDVLMVSPENTPPELSEINPYASVPTLIDRDLVLFEARIIMEYLDERFPHPPLLPVYPVARAETRKMLYRIERDWYTLVHQILKNVDKENAQAKLMQSLCALDPIFADKPYFLSDEFSLLDCALAPFFWRLPHLGIHIPKENKALHAYKKRIFARDSFQSSLTEVERQLRVA